MARNKVQFQKGLSEAQFASLYGTEDQCREAVMRWRWPSGFVCPVCDGKHHSLVRTRALYTHLALIQEAPALCAAKSTRTYVFPTSRAGCRLFFSQGVNAGEKLHR